MKQKNFLSKNGWENKNRIDDVIIYNITSKKHVLIP